MIIDHIGIVVKSIEIGIQQWEAVFGYKQMTEIVENTRQKVKVVFLEKKDSLMIKLIQPTDDSSPVSEFAKRSGGLHHLCFKCSDLHGTINNLKEKKMRLITKPEPGEAFDNELISFMIGKNGLNIELIETDKKAKKIIKETTAAENSDVYKDKGNI